MSSHSTTPTPLPKQRRPLGQRIIRRVVFTLGGLFAAFVVLAIIGAIVGPRTPVATTTPAPAAAPAPLAPPAPPAAPAPIPPAPVVAPVVAPVAPAAPANLGQVVHVASVHDGDTFTDSAGNTYRPLVMDSCEVGTPGGTSATTEARQLLVGQDVTVTAEPGVDRDSYGRLLRYVTLADGRDFADTMLEADHTAVYAGENDASAAKVAEGRTHDTNGRTCGDPAPQTTTHAAPVPTYDAPYVPSAPKRHTGHSGHPCGPGERDGDNDGYCGEG